LLIYDENGQDRAEADGSMLSQKVIAEVSAQPVTDVFLMSHGWMGDITRRYFAVRLLDRQSDECVGRHRGYEKAASGVPAVVGRPALAQPALGDENVGSFALEVGDVVQPLVDDYAKRLGDAPESAKSSTPSSVPMPLSMILKTFRQRSWPPTIALTRNSV